MLTIRAAMASVGMGATAVLLSLAAPALSRFLAAEVPRVYGTAVAWMKPPYIYLVINGIIISIAASSRFHKGISQGDSEAFLKPSTTAVIQTNFVVDPVEMVELRQDIVVEQECDSAEILHRGAEKVFVGGDLEEDEYVIVRSSWEPMRRFQPQDTPVEQSISGEKPLISSRIGQQRRSVRASPDEKLHGVARSKRGETLEHTWKTITDGRAIPLARHLKKSDTWDVHGRDRGDLTAAPFMRKSETFNDDNKTKGSPSPGSSRLRRDPSLGQDDLNRRVEAFISKFNQEMRLQRQESLQHYMDMINRGSH